MKGVGKKMGWEENLKINFPDGSSELDLEIALSKWDQLIKKG